MQRVKQTKKWVVAPVVVHFESSRTALHQRLDDFTLVAFADQGQILWTSAYQKLNSLD
jgi:hypothetical protein